LDAFVTSVQMFGRLQVMTVCQQRTGFDLASCRYPVTELTIDSASFLTGRVVDETEAPLVGAEVLLERDNRAVSFFARTTSSFLLPAPSPLTGTIWARYGRDSVSSRMSVEGRTGGVQLVVDCSKAIRTMLLRDDGTPVQAYAVSRANRSASWQDPSIDVQRSPRGIAVLKNQELLPGTWLYFRGPDFNEFRCGFPDGLPVGAVQRVTLMPQAEAQVRITSNAAVLDGTAAWLREVDPAADQSLRLARTYWIQERDEHGAWVIERVAYGQYTVSIESGGHVHAARTADVFRPTVDLEVAER
jgi:hypothetical protein